MFPKGYFVALLFLMLSPVVAQEDNHEATHEAENQVADDATETLEEVLAGHSFHGDAFNEGPRQKAYLMGGTGNVSFEITTSKPEAQAFINQGVGQLHGFWDLEAERSFRHAASIDEDCAMAYWGAALATVGKRERAQGFLKEAVARKDKVTPREKMYIEALEKYLEGEADDDSESAKKSRANAYLKALESITIEYPNDIEAKALIAHRIWYNSRDGIPISSYVAADYLLKDILEQAPLHPSHHYVIHLWDHRHPAKALKSAARCGVSAPGIAHMWHMPGHIYSRLKRYEDAVYQQEASARVDHAHMMRDQVLPDEIHNFAHNNEWLIRNLVFIGRANDALDLAKNMTELPRHPKYNVLEKRGSARYGRMRLLQVLKEFQLHEQSIEICQSVYLQTPDLPAEQVKCLRRLGCAAAITNQPLLVEQTLTELEWLAKENTDKKRKSEHRIKILESALNECPDLPPRPMHEIAEVDKEKAPDEISEMKKEIGKAKKVKKDAEKAILAVHGYQLVHDGSYTEAHSKLKEASGEDVSWLGELEFQAGDVEAGLKTIRDQIKRRPKEVIPRARLVYCEFENDNKEAAREAFEDLRQTSSSMDLDIELFSRLTPIAREFGFEEDWRLPIQLATDLGFRPPLDSLGPFRWSPPQAAEWKLANEDGEDFGSIQTSGRPHLVIFYLGHGCLHCAEQLQAFGPRVTDFEAAGIDVVAISSDDSSGLKQSIEDYGSEMPFPVILSDNKLEVFKQFRAYDDFEHQALHGTFLISGSGKILWQDISYEPFMDVEFLFGESQRLLDQTGERKSETAVSKR